MVPIFKREDWTLFRSLTTLGQMAGVPQRDISKLVVKELVDNALDAAGGADACTCTIGLLPDQNGFYVEDDGTGIRGFDEDIAALFSLRRPLISTKYIRLPSRGALGNGLRVVTGAVVATNGTLTVSTQGRTLRLFPDDDGTTRVERLNDNGHGGENEYNKQGTRVEVTLPTLDLSDALTWGDRACKLAEAGGTFYKGKTSGYWYDSEAFYELLRASA